MPHSQVPISEKSLECGYGWPKPRPTPASCETRGESSAPKTADEQAMRCAHWKRGAAAAAAPFDQVPSGENVPITVNRRDTVSREEASERCSRRRRLRCVPRWERRRRLKNLSRFPLLASRSLARLLARSLAYASVPFAVPFVSSIPRTEGRTQRHRSSPPASPLHVVLLCHLGEGTSGEIPHANEVVWFPYSMMAKGEHLQF